VKGDGVVVEFDGVPAEGRRPGAKVTVPNGAALRLEPVDPFKPTPEDLARYAGEYSNDEAEATYTFTVAEDALVRVDRYGSEVRLVPVYPDAFNARGTMYIFLRDDSGGVTGFSLSQGRVWDLRFQRVR
jgi:hypothetical protein